MEDRELEIRPLCRKINVHIMFNEYRNLNGNANQQGENLSDYIYIFKSDIGI